MILDTETKNGLAQYIELLEEDVIIKVSASNDEHSKKLVEFVNEVKEMSPKISVEKAVLAKTPSFSIDQKDKISGIEFAGIPLGHEFASFIMALLQVSGRPPKVSDQIIRQIQKIDKSCHFDTYISLTCHNCPEVVQALNIMSVINEKISHTMIDGAVFKEEVESKNVMAVPTVYLNDEPFGSGRMSMEQIIEKVIGTTDLSAFENQEPYDVLVVGGGPAGSSAAIYAARKGIRTGLVAETFGGQVRETLGIENLIGTKYIEGPGLSDAIEAHVNEYNVDVKKAVGATKIEKNDLIEVTLTNGAILKSKTAIIATGAKWRNIGVPGEQTFKNKGVAYCPHCDGPLFEGKHVAVVGGGNSGVEAAIDLAGLAKHVTVLEYNPQLKADQVLQKRLYSLPNVTVLTNAQTLEIAGSDKVEGVKYVDRESGKEATLNVQGVFILIGLKPNTEWLNGSLEQTKKGEIIVDKYGATNLPGVFAAGDCTDSAYKQIIISMGSGATAALSAFDYLIRNK